MGKLSENWSERMSGKTILPYKTALKDGMAVAKLTGKLQDQTKLAGVLSTLYNMRLPLLMVEYLGYPEQN